MPVVHHAAVGELPVHSPGILGFEMEKKYKAENFRKCSLCPPLLPVKSPKVFPERNILFF